MIRIAVKQHPPRWRRCLLLILLLAGTAALAGAGFPPEEGPPRHEALTWRRTRDGWEQPFWLSPKPGPRWIPFHPVFAAALAVLISAMALVGFEPRSCVHVPPPAPHFPTFHDIGAHAAETKRSGYFDAALSATSF